MTSDLTVTLDGVEYILSDESIEYITRTTEESFSENDYTDVRWTEYDNTFTDFHGPNAVDAEPGDPIIVIETSGHTVPASDVVQPQNDAVVDTGTSIDDPNDGEEEESGTSNVTLLPDSNEPDKSNYAVDEVVNEAIESREEQLENGRLPRAPVEETVEPRLVQLIPEAEGVVWSTAESLVPVSDTYYRNLQTRLDNPPVLPGENSDAVSSRFVERWKRNLESWGCEVLEDNSVSPQEERKPWNYESTDENETVNDGEVGSRWNL